MTVGCLDSGDVKNESNQQNRQGARKLRLWVSKMVNESSGHCLKLRVNLRSNFTRLVMSTQSALPFKHSTVAASLQGKNRMERCAYRNLCDVVQPVCGEASRCN